MKEGRKEGKKEGRNKRTRLQARRLEGSIPGRAKRFFSATEHLNWPCV